MAEERNDYFKNATPDTIPTLPEEEATAPTDMISEAVEEIVENVTDTFDGDDGDKEEEKD